MSLAYFCMFENTGRTSTRVELRAVQPEPVIEPPGWIPRYVVPLNSDTTVGGAEIVLARMAVEFARRKTARGMFDVPYPELRQWLNDQLAHANAEARPQIPRRPRRSADWYFSLAIRVFAGILALLLFYAYVVANIWGTFYCLFITSFRRRSLVYKVAETSLIFRMLDWRKTIQSLALIALNR